MVERAGDSSSHSQPASRLGSSSRCEVKSESGRVGRNAAAMRKEVAGACELDLPLANKGVEDREGRPFPVRERSQEE